MCTGLSYDVKYLVVDFNVENAAVILLVGQAMQQVILVYFVRCVCRWGQGICVLRGRLPDFRIEDRENYLNVSGWVIDLALPIEDKEKNINVLVDRGK